MIEERELDWHRRAGKSIDSEEESEALGATVWADAH